MHRDRAYECELNNEKNKVEIVRVAIQSDTEDPSHVDFS